MLNIKSVLFLTTFMLSNLASAQETYIMIDAVTLPRDSKQPTWIGMQFKTFRRALHLPTGKSLIPIKAGKFRIVHIDFQQNTHSELETLHFTESSPIQIDIAPGVINYVGLLQLEKDHHTGREATFNLSLVSDNQMISWACYEHADVFERMPLRMVNREGNEKLMKIKCKKSEKNKVSD